MRFFREAVTCVAMGWATFAVAGTAFQETITCPVDGEKFSITGTTSCSSLGRTMSFRPITSCDWVTQLPVCPSNGLPLYQDFSKTQIARLESLLASEDWSNLKTLSPWERAYRVAKQLGQEGTRTAFSVILRAFWFDPDALYASETALDELIKEGSAEIARSDAEQAAFLNAILAYALSAGGRLDEANARLEQASDFEEAPTSLSQYIAAIKACQSDMQREGCRPNQPFKPE